MTDGSLEGTKLVKDNLYPKLIDHYIEVLNGKMFFNARLDGFGEELWISDGTSEGTYILKLTAGDRSLMTRVVLLR